MGGGWEGGDDTFDFVKNQTFLFDTGTAKTLKEQSDEMAQTVKRSPCKSEGLSLDPRDQIKIGLQSGKTDLVNKAPTMQV